MMDTSVDDRYKRFGNLELDCLAYDHHCIFDSPQTSFGIKKIDSGKRVYLFSNREGRKEEYYAVSIK